VKTEKEEAAAKFLMR